ncbi:DUF4105 domain-containing protein [Salinisphaera orenii]|uniref:Membrane protein n=1 Tax=Salinisphaera orenii YIM 95161 TaxID=1051139 RepID=A0A423Q2P8_9GAMM|nr:DUF4105 domain-containing protein [Salinisphaera halophila]ROO32941.1 membrane protein [Salinisphaera halophila YIM 95161]
MAALSASLLWRLPLALGLTLLGAWGSGALWFRGPRGFAAVLLALWLALTLVALASLLAPPLRELRWPSLLVFALVFVALIGWWQTIRPAMDRDWAPDVARLLESERDGDRVTLHNVRNFDWRTREDFTPRWETRTYDLSQLRSADLIASHWMGPAIAHTLVSFGFTDGRQLVFSVEVRRTRESSFSAIGGLFKQSELVLIAADERDIVRTRSNVRGEDVYLYRVALPRAALRDLFLAYLDEAESLRREPRFYNTVLSNCTTIVYDMVKAIVPGLPSDYRLLASGYLPDYIYDLGALDTSRPLAELRARGHINARAVAADVDGHAAADFPRAIRRGVPAPDGDLIEPGPSSAPAEAGRTATP